MLNLLVGDWRAIALRGLAALAFGIFTLVWPHITLWALVVLFGAFVLVDGVFTLVAVIRNEPGTRQRRGWLIFEGIASVAVGIITFVWPDITALALLFLIAAWAFILGTMRLAAAIQMRREVDDWWLPALSGALSIAFAVLLVITPGDGALVITWLIGWFAVLIGVLLLMLAFRVRKLQHEVEGGAGNMRPATT
jgi:uncharacterized membrane protein HdeD (DUF308 family)